jgi:alkaline phosphatase D
LPYEDYLYKWYLWHWAVRDLTSQLPAIVQTDDHDVFQGNLWGWEGRLASTDDIDAAGYIYPSYFVNMVHRTMTGHNPDPHDPGPGRNGITHYYGSFNYGGIGFAVLEDRKFKTPPVVTDPAQQVLLGDRQLQFLREWGQNWEGHQVKVVVSQTTYSSMHCGSNGAIYGDPDTAGCPKAGRDRAVRLFQEAGAFILCGDQHLATLVRLGVDKPSDSSYQFSVPALGNVWWRWFYPSSPGAGREPGEPEYLGEFMDPFGNHFRMLAVANPERKALFDVHGSMYSRLLIPKSEMESFYDNGHTRQSCRGQGYGILRINKPKGEITVECWPQEARPDKGDAMFEGWPITVPVTHRTSGSLVHAGHSAETKKP